MDANDKATSPSSSGKKKKIAVIVSDQENLYALVRNGLDIANTHRASLTILWVSFLDHLPDTFSIPADIQASTIDEITILGKNPEKKILKHLKAIKPYILCMALDKLEKGQHLVDSRLASVLHLCNCDVCLYGNYSVRRFEESPTAIIPFSDDRNTRFAIRKAFKIKPQLSITAIKTISPSLDVFEIQMIEEEFKKQTKEWHDNEKFKTKVVYSSNPEQTLIQEARDVGFLLIGASKGNRLLRTLIGDFRNNLLEMTTSPVVVLREHQGKSGVALYRGWSIFHKLLPDLTREDRIEAYRQIRKGGRPSKDFYIMIALSAAIASFGLLQNSAAAIIGAMLVAPLMSAIIGMGLAIIHGDLRFLALTSSAIIRGSCLAIATGWLFGLFSVTGEVTQQIVMRTDPSLLDMGIALVSGIAAAYAMCRADVSSSLPGVAVAVALVPPLSTVGICIALGRIGYAIGASKLFLTNLFAIVFASAIVFALLGFKPHTDATQEHKSFKLVSRALFGSSIMVAIMSVMLLIQTVEDINEVRWEKKVERELTRYLALNDVEKEDLKWSLKKKDDGTYVLFIKAWTDSHVTQKDLEELDRTLESGLKKTLDLNITVVPVNFYYTQH